MSEMASPTDTALASAVPREPVVDPTFGLVPPPTTELLQNRLNGWSQLVKRLIVHFETLSASFHAIEEVNRKFCRDIAAPFRGPMKWEDLFNATESHQAVLGLYQSSCDKLATDAKDSANMIDKHVVIPLKTLFADLRRRAGDPDKDWISLDRDLKTDRDAFVRLLRDLKLSILNHGGSVSEGSQQEDPKAIERATADPWVAKRALLRHIETCIGKQETYRTALIRQQNAIAEYEKEEVIQTLKVTLSAFFDWRANNLVNEQDIYTQLKTKLLTLNPSEDWTIFTANHRDEILENDQYDPVQLKSISFPGREDQTTTAIRVGTMFKKVSGSGFHFKRSWKEVNVVVTNTGYLHVLSGSPGVGGVDDLEFPETSLYLPDCTIAPLMMNEKEPEEFTIQEKNSGMFGGATKHKFKGSDMDDSASWWQFLRNFAEEPGVRRGSANATGASTVTSPSNGKVDLLTDDIPRKSLGVAPVPAGANGGSGGLASKLAAVAAKNAAGVPAVTTGPSGDALAPTIAGASAASLAGADYGRKSSQYSNASNDDVYSRSTADVIQKGQVSPTDFGADIAGATTVNLPAPPQQPVTSVMGGGFGEPVDYGSAAGAGGFAEDPAQAANGLFPNDPQLSMAEKMEHALGSAVKQRGNNGLGMDDVWGAGSAWGNEDMNGGSAWN